MAVLQRPITWLALYATAAKEVTLDRFPQPANSLASSIRALTAGQNTFSLEQSVIRPLTNVGEVTAHILGFNSSGRLHERQEMIRFGKYPGKEASALIAE